MAGNSGEAMHHWITRRSLVNVADAASDRLEPVSIHSLPLADMTAHLYTHDAVDLFRCSLLSHAAFDDDD